MNKQNRHFVLIVFSVLVTLVGFFHLSTTTTRPVKTNTNTPTSIPVMEKNLKIDSHLWELYAVYNNDGDFIDEAKKSDIRLTGALFIGQIYFVDTPRKEELDRLNALGAEDIIIGGQDIVEGKIPLNKLEEIAGWKNVKAIIPVVGFGLDN